MSEILASDQRPLKRCKVCYARKVRTEKGTALKQLMYVLNVHQLQDSIPIYVLRHTTQRLIIRKMLRIALMFLETILLYENFNKLFLVLCLVLCFCLA